MMLLRLSQQHVGFDVEILETRYHTLKNNRMHTSEAANQFSADGPILAQS